MNKTNVQVQMYDDSIRKIESMKETFGTENRSEIIKSSVAIAEMVTSAIKNGHHLYIGDDTDKIQTEIKIPSVVVKGY